MIKTPIRVAVFGSFYRGLYVLKELIKMQTEGMVQLVGVATDDPSQAFTSPHKRVWQYPHAEEETTMVAGLAKEKHIPVYSGKVKTDEFYDIFENQWKPEICYMATFGQLIDKRLFEYPKLGFFNLHPSSDNSWPSYVGGNPFQMMLDNGEDYCVISLHEVDRKFDNGNLIDKTERIYFTKPINVPELHKLTSPRAGLLVRKHLDSIVRGR